MQSDVKAIIDGEALDALVGRDGWHAAVAELRQGGNFIVLTDLCGADYPGRPDRFEVVAHLYDPKGARRVRIRTRCCEADPTVPSIADIYPAADWYEREAFDMFGICFAGHPDLTRILCDDGVGGHPLRKDFPRGGL